MTKSGKNMKICDAHVHLGKSGPWQPYMNPSIYIEELVPLFDRYNVERAVVFPNPNVGDKYPEMNDYIAKCVEKHPGATGWFRTRGSTKTRRHKRANTHEAHPRVNWTKATPIRGVFQTRPSILQ